MLFDDIKAMNVYMNRVSLTTFSFFDSGSKSSSGSEPERFFHGFVLGLIVELENRYVITSNRESAFGRYDVMLEPSTTLRRIDAKEYATSLTAKGIPQTKIRKYGFAFHGKNVLIGNSLISKLCK